MKDKQIKRPENGKVGSWVRYADYLENELKKAHQKIQDELVDHIESLEKIKKQDKELKWWEFERWNSKNPE